MRGPTTKAEATLKVADEVFDEAGYLRINPDVAEAVRQKKFRSGYSHYVAVGFKDGRPAGGWPLETRDHLLTISLPGLDSPAEKDDIPYSIEAFIASPRGLLVIGWIDDTESPIDNIRIVNGQWRCVISGKTLIRLRREDVEASLGRGTSHCFGFCAFLATATNLPSAGPCVVEIWMASGHGHSRAANPRQIDDVEMRNTLLSYLADAGFLGNKAVEGMACLEGGAGAQILELNRIVTERIKSAPYVERFGTKRRVPHGSIVVCLYGKAEFLFLQNCLYAGLPKMENYEFIFVSNSPEIAERLLQEARAASLIYGLEITVVVLSGNAGFGAANNVAAAAARSMRILIVNPDVFPKDRDWAAKHTRLIGALRADQCRLFGVPLYYDDGTLMHGGMYFELDTGLSLAGGIPRLSRMVRVEHYGKGAPDTATHFLEPRPVPAVTGAFISCERTWFEQLGGFTEDYVFGHYEDADLCLKSWQRGTAPWLLDIRMWHLEGKGSTRLPVHEGGSLVNRWLFSKRWTALIADGMLGQSPARLGKAVTAAPAPIAPPPPAAVKQMPPPVAKPARARAAL